MGTKTIRERVLNFSDAINVRNALFVSMPEGTRVLSCGVDGNEDVVVWFECDPMRSKKLRRFVFYRTDESITHDTAKYSFVGTVAARFHTHDGNLFFAWHIFVEDE